MDLNLIGGLEHFLFFHILGMSSSQLTIRHDSSYFSYYPSHCRGFAFVDDVLFSHWFIHILRIDIYLSCT